MFPAGAVLRRAWSCAGQLRAARIPTVQAVTPRRPLPLSSRLCEPGRRRQGMQTRSARSATTMQAGENFHDAAGRRFGVSVNGVEAYVTYELDTAAKTLDLQHTFTPPELRGQGLAGQVVKLAFDYARENGLKVIPTCSYIPVFVKRNPEWIRFTLM
mmetsp:Transcript_1218/g.2842  ORF Transcript_1218/g.2842 Transcript_1218/m.2842 type:complete len:157 (-) Transcript_1218:211-681(-)